MLSTGSTNAEAVARSGERLDLGLHPAAGVDRRADGARRLLLSRHGPTLVRPAVIGEHGRSGSPIMAKVSRADGEATVASD